MTHRAKKVQMKSVLTYMETEEVQITNVDQKEQDQEGQTSISLGDIRNIIVQEFGKIEAEFWNFKEVYVIRSSRAEI